MSDVARRSAELSDDDALAALGPVLYGMFTKANPEQIARQIERCWRENVPGWRIELPDDSLTVQRVRFLEAWTPDTQN